LISDLNETSRRIVEALETVRPYLQEDGGDVEFVSVSPDGIVEGRLLGECAGCSLAIMTLRAGIERIILNAVPGIRRIEAVQ